MSSLPTVEEIKSLQSEDVNSDVDFGDKNTKRLLKHLEVQKEGFLQKVYAFMRDYKCLMKMDFVIHLHHTTYFYTDIYEWLADTFRHIGDQGFYVRLCRLQHTPHRCNAVLTDEDVSLTNHYSMAFELEITCDPPLNDGKDYIYTSN